MSILPPSKRHIVKQLTRIIALFFFPLTYFAQVPIPQNGVELPVNNSMALYNARIYVNPQQTIENGVLIVRAGKVVAVGQQLEIPKDIPSIDLKGKVIVPSFIELFSSVGIPEVPKKSWNPVPQIESNKPGPYYWNESIHPEIDPTTLYSIDKKAIEELHKMGFGLAVVHQNDGIAQGSGTLVSLGFGPEKDQLIGSNTASFYSFKKGVSQQDYPSSQMGSIALLRQALYDSEWHQKNGTSPNYSLEALARQSKSQSIFFTSEKYELLRVHAIAKEFKRNFTIVGTGHEYTLGKIWDTLPHTILLPLNFPEAYDLKDPYIARQIPLSDLKHWELAPSNPAYMMQQGEKFGVTSHGIKQASDFWANLHKALSRGWTVSDALRSLTTTPASLLGIEKDFGTLETGKWASFSIFESDPFLYEVKLTETWTKGLRIVKQETVTADIRGKYDLKINGTNYDLTIKGSVQKPEATVQFPRTITDSTGNPKADTMKAEGFIQFSENDLVLQFLLKSGDDAQHFSLKGIVDATNWTFTGDGTNNEGSWIKWSAKRTAPHVDKEEQKTAWSIDTSNIGKQFFPNMSYGFTSQPKAQNILIKNATIWTNEADGILTKGYVLVENGKIKASGKGDFSGALPSETRTIDAEGKHVTSGIIDEHSHIAISKGVNEGGQAISAEVRIGDVINPDDINVYRQLSGGVTAAQLLHGSANPVGGQSALIKLKWGHSPKDFLIPNAPKFVKFALGENVKQANWGEFNTVRFPQTRMGVEQVYIDGFSRAIAYHKALETALASKGKTPPPAKDLELDALYEIVTGKRRITCHSYVQSEINMLMHVADSFGFTINTFTHILEGYKVADKMKNHGAGASTFADWWAYKMEVKDAIPYNAALMHSMGVTVALNSDDAEMGRRLNQEAGKVVKYGGVPEEDAWKMVTLNPAKLLQLDKQMGSIKAGKDADIVIWSTNPLSIQAKVLFTIVDGEILFESAKDAQMRLDMDVERARITAAMSGASKKGAPTKTFKPKKSGAYHCNTLGEELSHEENEH